MAADGMVMHGSRSSAAMVSNLFSRNIPVSARDWVIFPPSARNIPGKLDLDHDCGYSDTWLIIKLQMSSSKFFWAIRVFK